MSPASPTATMCTSFPQFSKLPGELQLLVWEAAAASSMKQQVIQGLVECANLRRTIHTASPNLAEILIPQLERLDAVLNPVLVVFPFASTHASPPAILSICHTSRQIALTHKNLTRLQLRGEDDHERLAWFDFTSDIVFLPHMRSAGYGILIQWVHLDNKEVRERIQHLAAPWALFHAGNQCLQTEPERRQWWITMLCQLYDIFPRLTDLYLCIPAEKQNDLPDRGAHWLEDRRLDYCLENPTWKQRPVLEPIPGPLNQIQLPPCHCKVKPASLGDTIDEIEKCLRSEWLQPQLQKDFNRRRRRGQFKVPAPFRVHGRIFRRENLDI